MKVSLNTLREWDSELVIVGNQVHMHDKGEWICVSDAQFSDDEWNEHKDEFYDSPHTFQLGDDDNGGNIHSEHFPEVVDTTMEKFENHDFTPESGVYLNCWRVFSSLLPIVVEFPTDIIDDNTEYDVEYWIEEVEKQYVDIESYDYQYKVWPSKVG